MDTANLDSSDFFVHIFISLPKKQYKIFKKNLVNELNFKGIKYRLNIIQSASEITDKIKKSISQAETSAQHFFLWCFHSDREGMEFANGEELDWESFIKIILRHDYGVDGSNIYLCACESLYASMAISSEVESEQINNFIAPPTIVNFDEAIIYACQFLSDVAAGRKIQKSTIHPFRLIRGEDLKTISQLRTSTKKGNMLALISFVNLLPEYYSYTDTSL